MRQTECRELSVTEIIQCVCFGRDWKESNIEVFLDKELLCSKMVGDKAQWANKWILVCQLVKNIGTSKYEFYWKKVYNGVWYPINLSLEKFSANFLGVKIFFRNGYVFTKLRDCLNDKCNRGCCGPSVISKL